MFTALGREPELSRLGLEAARLAAAGYRVFPIAAGRKEPPITGWRIKASNDPATVVSWWAEWPDANIGYAIDEARIVIDIDEQVGLESWERLLQDLNLELTDQIPTSRTPRGGLHRYYLLPCPGLLGPSSHSFGSAYPNIDIRALGGYTLVPGSRLPRGNYRWEPGRSLFEAEPTAIPDALLGAIQVGRKRSVGQPPRSKTANPHERSKHTPETGGSPVNYEVLRSLLSCIDGRDDRNRFIKVMFGVRLLTQRSEEGWEEFDRWCRGPGDPPSNYDYDENRRQWDSPERQSGPRITEGTLIRMARRGGWRGSNACLTASPPPPMPEPTLPVAKSGMTREELSAIARKAVASHPDCGRSLAVSGPPGLSKTRERLRHEIQMLASGRLQTVVSAHQTRERALEVYQDAEWRRLADSLGVRIVLSLGRGSNPSQPFFCSNMTSEARARDRRERGLGSCQHSGSGHRQVCSSTLGHYLHDKAVVEGEMAMGGPVLVITTIANLSNLEPTLIRHGRSICSLTLDDPGNSFGLFDELKFSATILIEYRGRLATWLQTPGPDRDPDQVTLAEVLRGFVDGLLSATSGDLDSSLVQDFVSELSGPVRDAVLAWDANESPPFDHWHAGLPGQPLMRGRDLLRVLRGALRGCRSVVKCSGSRDVVLSTVNDVVLRATREGRACFLSVGVMPDVLVDHLNIRREVGSWELSNELIGVRPTDGRNKWHGKPASSDQDNAADVLIRGILTRFIESGGRPAYVGTKKDTEALEEVAGGRAAIGHYGRDHAGTNRYEGRGQPMIRRNRPHPLDVSWHTAALLGVIGLEPSSSLGQMRQEAREAGPNEWVIAKVPVDPVERQFHRAQVMQFMLNAIGRCRPLTSYSGPIYIFDETPIDGAPFTRVIDVRELGQLLGIDVQDLLDTDSKSRSRDETQTEEPVAQDLAEELEASPQSVPEMLEEDPQLPRQLHQLEDTRAKLTCSKAVPNRRYPSPIPLLVEHVKLAEELDPLLDPSFRIGRHGIAQILADRTGFPLRWTRSAVDDLRRGGGIPGCRGFSRRMKFERLVQELHQVLAEVASGVIADQGTEGSGTGTR
ncbi:MAG: bifunctional DNA primase/polymerase [Planctomycetes bacterium]|nr:bifunctional DNA primase/polymerase [Planctomycetota bacterium]